MRTRLVFFVALVMVTMLTALCITANQSVVNNGFMTPPIWIIGETWHYTARLPYQSPDFVFYDLTWKVIGPGVIASHETEGGHDQLNYYTEQLEWIGVDGAVYNMTNGGAKHYEPVSKMNPPIPLYAWPLTAGKEWGNCSENIIPPGGKHCNSFKVVMIEDISTRIGTFHAAVIEHRLDGKLLARKWYAPTVKNIVRSEQFVTYQNERLRLTLEIDATTVVTPVGLTKR